jgi:hypothetical protein
MGRIEAFSRVQEIRQRLAVLERELYALPRGTSPEFSARVDEGYHLMYELGNLILLFPELKHEDITH